MVRMPRPLNRSQGPSPKWHLDYVAQMRQVQPNGPCNVLGWSFGGTSPMRSLSPLVGLPGRLPAPAPTEPCLCCSHTAPRDGGLRTRRQPCCDLDLSRLQRQLLVGRGDDLLVPTVVQLHKRDESAVREELRPQSPIDLWNVAERPEGPASRVDALPCRPSLDAERDEVAHDRRSALPVMQQNRAQPTPDMGVESAQHKL